MKWSAAIGKVCFLSGKSDAPQRRTHLRERVNTFSFCGTGGSFLFCRGRSSRSFAAIGGREHWPHCGRSLRSFAAIGGRKRRTRCNRLSRSADARIGCTATVRRDRRTQASNALRSFAAVGYGIAGRAPLSPFAPRGGSSVLRRFCEACPLFCPFAANFSGRFAARCLADGVLRRITSSTAFCGASPLRRRFAAHTGENHGLPTFFLNF